MRRIGIIGGGQLGRMTIEEARKYGGAIDVLAPEWPSPAAELADEVVIGALDDGDAIRELAARVDVVSYEIEKVDAATLAALEREGKTVMPGAAVLAIAQDKARQKELWEKAGIPSAPWTPVEGLDEEALAKLEPMRSGALRAAVIGAAAERIGGFPVVQKARRGGYDGRGVAALDGPGDAVAKSLPVPSFVERALDFAKELAVVVVRAPDGETAVYPCVEMVFDPRAKLCESVLAPADEPEPVRRAAEELALRVVRALDEAAKAAGSPIGAAGVFGVELFLMRDGSMLVNEVAPRPHNSGHFSVEACASSQFDQYYRLLAGLPPGSTELLRPAMMMNLLGAPGSSGEPEVLGLERALAVPGVSVHLYGKAEVRPFRKMGHLTALGRTAAEARERAEAALDCIRITGR